AIGVMMANVVGGMMSMMKIVAPSVAGILEDIAVNLAENIKTTNRR
ncbi:hypothetical protein CDAR_68961, partial [Caerostris darwini]